MHYQRRVIIRSSLEHITMPNLHVAGLGLVIIAKIEIWIQDSLIPAPIWLH
jgi:hypothetical protein